MHWHSSQERRGFRGWCHIGDRSCVNLEVSALKWFCGLSFSVNYEGWKFHAALPGLAVWFSLKGFLFLRSDDDRECSLRIHDWTIWVTPWGRSMEWRSADPWWIRGLAFNIPDILMGRQRCVTEMVKAGIPLVIPMPEGVYPATAKIERMTWTRPRWFPHTRTFVNVEVPQVIPFQGKGENSWDCGDDGLFGYSVEGTSLEHAVAHGIESVLNSRRRYGMPSTGAIQKALLTVS